MINSDTIKLLRECDAGISMGISSIDQVYDSVCSPEMKGHLSHCRQEHADLKTQIETSLANYHDCGKDLNPIVRGMSWVKTNMSLAIDGSDSAVANLITDGCNMGVKSLSEYLNRYQAADENSKDICKKLIELEDQLAAGLRVYL